MNFSCCIIKVRVRVVIMKALYNIVAVASKNWHWHWQLKLTLTIEIDIDNINNDSQYKQL